MRSQRSNGWVLIEERFEDDGYSGATSDRPALERVLRLIRKREVDRLVLYRLDRLSRSLLGCAGILHELRECGVGLVIVTAPELGNSAQDSFMLNILATFAQFEREMIASRIAESRVRLKARGLRIAGGVPFGYDADPRTKQLLQSASEAPVVRWMFDQAAAAKTPAEIADAANAKGWRTKATIARRMAKNRGGNLWTARQLIATLRNPVYLGLFRDKGDFRIGHHEAIVTQGLFAAVSAQLDARRTRTPGRRYQIEWPLKGRITCAACGTPMSPHTIRHRNFIYRYYRCRSTAGGQRPCGHQISAPTIEGVVMQNLMTLLDLRLDVDQIRNHVASVVYDHRDQSVRATFIRPPEPEGDPDSKEVELPLGKRRRRKASRWCRPAR